MTRYSQPSFDFYQQSPSSLEAKPAFSEDDEMSVLDDKILDPTTSPELSSIPDHRRSSAYDHPHDAFAHRDSIWSDLSQPLSSSSQSRHNSHVGHTMFDSSSNPFMRVDGTLPASTTATTTNNNNTIYAQQTPWSLTKESGSCTPNAMYDHFTTEFDNSSSAPFAGGAVGPVGAINMPPMSYRPSMAYATQGAVAMSPQSSHSWMPASTDMPEASSRPTKSPSHRHSSPLSVRRDGIRKKNARFEIPAERTLGNIESLIQNCRDDEEAKELKQQKRLLRNRQAALDSRQRKKVHTEKLEEEKKQFTQIISDLEQAVQNMKIREAEMLREKGEWMSAQQQFHQYIDGMHMEKDEMIRVHTLETAELRKKNNILKETVEKLERQAKPVPLSNDFSDFENLTMDNGQWDDFGIPLEPESTQSSSSALVVSMNNEKAPEKMAATTSSPSSNDHPFSWNAFYMCLLFGAFIASNSASPSARSIPQLSEEYRAESANVLKAVLNSSPPELAHPAPGVSSSAAAAVAPLPTTISGAEMAQMTAGASSNLDGLHSSLAMPTKEQEQEQVFSLNADQYNSLTTFDDTNVDYKSQQHPSNLQQALSNMRNNAAQKAPTRAVSDVHSRSLMWDRVPEKVIRDFQQMVQEYGATPTKEKEAGFNRA